MHIIKQLKRSAERTFNKNPSLSYKTKFNEIKKTYRKKLKERRSEFYSDKINTCEKGSKMLFKNLRKLTRLQKYTITPNFSNDEDVTERLSQYFIKKIECVREYIKIKLTNCLKDITQ